MSTNTAAPERTLSLLLIEDSATDARLLRRQLEDGFFGAGRVEHEQTLATGIERLANGGIDAVLLDLGLPDSSGLDTFHRVAEHRSGAAVVVVTGSADARLAEDAVAHGAQDYLVKDDSTAEGLARAINYAIRRQRVLDDLDQARQAQLDAKDGLLSHVSHELRTPLAAVHQFVSLLADGTAGQLTAEQHDFISVIARNVKQLAMMIDDLLAVARLGRDALSVNPRPTALDALVRECVAAFEPLARDRDICLDVHVPRLPDVMCDPWRTREVLNNLLDNAIRFAPRGGSVMVEAQACDDRVCVRVRDSGPGILPENRERVFERFFQERADDGLGRSGLGLGLFVARQTIEHQGGECWVDDSASGGAVVAFTVPMAQPEAEGGRV